MQTPISLLGGREFDSFIVLDLTSSTNGSRGAGVGAVCLSSQLSMKAFGVVLTHSVAVVGLINVFTREMDCLGTCRKRQWWGELHYIDVQT